MALAQRQELRQSQSLVMTPQLQQAIKLLQLANIELVEYVDELVEGNPLLEVPEEPRDSEDAAEAPLDIDYDEIYAPEGKSEYIAGPCAAFSGGSSGGGGGGFEGGALAWNKR